MRLQQRKTKCINQNSQIHALERLGVLMKPFVQSKFAYCPLVWMCCDKTYDNRIKYFSERALRTVCNENVSTFEKRLGKDNSVTIYVRNLRTLAI